MKYLKIIKEFIKSITTKKPAELPGKLYFCSSDSNRLYEVDVDKLLDIRGVPRPNTNPRSIGIINEKEEI